MIINRGALTTEFLNAPLVAAAAFVTDGGASTIEFLMEVWYFMCVCAEYGLRRFQPAKTGLFRMHVRGVQARKWGEK